MFLDVQIVTKSVTYGPRISTTTGPSRACPKSDHKRYTKAQGLRHVRPTQGGVHTELECVSDASRVVATAGSGSRHT